MKCIDCKKEFEKEDMWYNWLDERYYCRKCQELLKEDLIEEEDWGILDELDL